MGVNWLQSIIMYAVFAIIYLSNNFRFASSALSVVAPKKKVIVPNDEVQIRKITDFKPSINQSSNKSPSIRVRSTIEDDLPTVIDLLASETIPPLEQSTQLSKVKQFRPALFGNWNASMKKLKNEASLTSQLTHRLAAINQATKVLSIPSEDSNQIDDHQMKRRVLWGNDTFRSKVETAVRHTSACEGTIWDNWNFAITPENKMLHHFMLSATDDEFLDQVVGFCEVGICEVPSEIEGFGHQSENCIIPCIGNLVVSPNHRRRGVGKKLVQSVIRLLKTYEKQVYNTDLQHQDESLLGLFVDETNDSAIRLYEQTGFKVVGKCKQNESDRIFMTHHLQ